MSAPIIDGGEAIPGVQDDARARNSAVSSQSSVRSSGIGVELEFGQMRRSITNEQVNHVYCQFITDFGMLLFILVIL